MAALKAIFYPVFFFIVAVFLANFLIWGVQQFLRKSLKEELIRIKGEGKFRLPRERGYLIGACLGLLIAFCAISFLVFGRPVFGLFGIFLFPFFSKLTSRFRAFNRKESFDDSALRFLVALRGLTKVGLSLPTALFQVSKTFPSPFAKYLSKSLARFQDGYSLTDTLQSFRKRAGLGFSGVAIMLLEMAHTKGLQAGPILEQIVPLLEAEQQTGKRILGIRKSAGFQALIAFLMPWVLGVVLRFFQPEMVNEFIHSPIAFLIVGIALCFQICGVLVLWHLSAFY